jgi:hypothetical protein
VGIRIDILNESREEECDAFLLQDPGTLLYASNKYRKLLKAFLGEDDKYLVASDVNGNITGVLPTFIKKNKNYGNVLNSLPFYGSYGGIIEHRGTVEVRESLLNAFYSLAEENECVSSTLITSPFERNINYYETNLKFTYKNERIGQINELPDSGNALDNVLMKSFEEVRRRNIRKALKSAVEVKNEISLDVWEFLISTHKNNMKAIGGIAKPEHFFELIPDFFTWCTDYKIFTAYKDDQPIAALLLFYFNKTVEYFTPVVVDEYRTYQPLSLIVFEAIKDAVARGYRWWNWGGTWKNQTGVYNFKKKWGAKEYPYYYYVNVHEKGITGLSKDVVLREYPYYYVLPFDRLNDERTIKIGESHMRRKSNG